MFAPSRLISFVLCGLLLGCCHFVRGQEEWLSSDEMLGYPERPWWQPQSFTGQMLWLSRTRGSDEALLLTSGQLNPVTLLVDHTPAVYASDLTFPAEIGVRASVLFGRLGSLQSELSYLGVFDQSSTILFSDAVDETGLVFFDTVLFTTTTDMTQHYESDLHTAEWNIWCDEGWRIQGMFGARWYQQSEELEQYETFDVGDGATTEIKNDLIGGQLGFRAFLFERGPISVFTIAKGGVYTNRVHLSGTLQNGGVQLAAIDASDRTTSCAGELNLTALWQVTPYFSCHVGYTGLWLTQVATINDQLNQFSTTGTGSFEYEGISYQGGHFGLTLAW